MAFTDVRRTVEDVMTAAVVAVDPIAPYKEVARLLAENRISGLPVLSEGWQVVGVISEADLLAAQRRTRRTRPAALTAGDLMTAPPVTIGPDAAVAAAARVMTAHRIGRLPVAGDANQLIGIVSRGDLLRVFLRPDADIIGDTRRLLGDLRCSGVLTVAVRHGVVTLTGPAASVRRSILRQAMRMIRDVDGVVGVEERLTGAQEGTEVPVLR